MSMPRVTILYNEPTLPADHPDADSEHDVLETADIIARHLQTAGLMVSRVGVTANSHSLLRSLDQAKPDCVFNLYEGTAGWGNSEEYVAGLLELLKIPYTGCPTLPMTLCRNKPLSKRLFAGAGIPTAAYYVVGEGPCPPCPIPWPVIVKPGEQDASVGIDQLSVCVNQEQLVERVEYLRKTYGPSVLVEQLVVGREFHVPVIEMDGKPLVLPFTEILFPPPADGQPIWPIVTFDAKWKPKSRDFAATPAKNPAEVDDALRANVSRIVLQTFALMECRDYARVDLRVDATGQPYVLEMNPNPCINPLAGVAAALESAKIPYTTFLLGCVRSALRRGPHPELANFSVTGNRMAVFSSQPDHVAQVWDSSIRTTNADLAAMTESLALTEAERNDLMARLASPDDSSIAFVVQNNGQTIGLAKASCFDFTQRMYRLDVIAVRADQRRTGVGTALLSAVERNVAACGGRGLLAFVSSSAGFGVVRQFLTARGYLASGDVAEYYLDGCSRMTFAKSFPAVVTPPHSGPDPVRFAGTGGGLL
ncbi:MAG: GNAT family N-acetyltransferase [Gemmataceae bacterium]